MDNTDLLNKVHKRILNELMSHGESQYPKELLEKIFESDSRLRKALADLYLNLAELGNASIAVDMLAEHTAMLVDMINQFKKRP
jgi:hypothetical protein